MKLWIAREPNGLLILSLLRPTLSAEKRLDRALF